MNYMAEEVLHTELTMVNLLLTTSVAVLAG